MYFFCRYIQRNGWRRQFFLLSFLLKPEVFLLPLSLSFRHKILKIEHFSRRRSTPCLITNSFCSCLGFFLDVHCIFLQSMTLKRIPHQTDVHCYTLLSCGHLPANCFPLCKQELQLHPLPHTRWVLHRTFRCFWRFQSCCCDPLFLSALRFIFPAFLYTVHHWRNDPKSS